MLVQRSRREVPDHDAFVETTSIRHSTFMISVVRSRGLATDWGVQSELVKYIARLYRSQVSIMLAGRGYFGLPGAIFELRPGDVVESDQLLQEHEGYAGSPCEALLVEWEDGSVFGSARRGALRRSRIGVQDVERLRALVARLPEEHAEEWVLELHEQLGALGLPIARHHDLRTDEKARAIYRQLGTAVSRLHEHPSLAELAESLDLTPRQTRRNFRELQQEFNYPHQGWRDYLNDVRLGWVTQLLSIPEMRLAEVAKLAGYRSPVALVHAFSLRGAGTPATLAARLEERLG